MRNPSSLANTFLSATETPKLAKMTLNTHKGKQLIVNNFQITDLTVAPVRTFIITPVSPALVPYSNSDSIIGNLHGTKTDFNRILFYGLYFIDLVQEELHYKACRKFISSARDHRNVLSDIFHFNK